MKPAPGTWGSLGALPFGIFILIFGHWPVLLAASIIVSLAGLWAADYYETASKKHDAKEIVIDEVAGMWISMLPCAINPLLIGLAFILFRFFDILKPWPIGWIDKNVPGGRGVMADDILAGIIVAMIIMGLRYAGFG